MKRATIIATLAFLAGAAASYYGLPRPIAEKAVTAVAERVIPKEAGTPDETRDWGPMQPQTITCRSEGWAVDVPSGKRTTFNPIKEKARATLHDSRRILDVDAAYYRALHREGLVPVTEHRAP